MIVQTRRFGAAEQIEVPEERVFELYPGLGGFEDHHNFAVLIEPDSPVEWLQSLDDPGVCFPMIEPFLIDTEYQVELSDGDASAIGAKVPEDVSMRVIVTVREPVEETTANMLAPLVFNPKTRLGRQIVLQESDYPIRALVFTSLEAAAASKPAKAA